MTNEAETAPPPPSGPNQWERIAAGEQFKELLRIKRRFIISAFAFFLVYYFALPLLVGYAPKLASARVTGSVTVAYLLALSQFFVGWCIAGLYLLASRRFDALTRDILANVLRRGDE